MAAPEMRYYEHGSIAEGQGNLIDVTNITFGLANGAKLVHVKGGTGVVGGNRESKISFDSKISVDGPERDYWKQCQRLTIKQLRIKISGRTFVYNGVYETVDGDAPLDDATSVKCSFIGVMEDL